MDSIIKSELSSPDFNELHREHSKNLFSIGVHEDLVFTIGQKWLICVNDITFFVLKLTEECLFLILLEQFSRIAFFSYSGYRQNSPVYAVNYLFLSHPDRF